MPAARSRQRQAATTLAKSGPTRLAGACPPGRPGAHPVDREFRWWHHGPLANVLLTPQIILTVRETRSSAVNDAALSDRSQPLDSAAALRWASQAISELSRADCIPVTSASTGSPAKESFVVTCTPVGSFPQRVPVQGLPHQARDSHRPNSLSSRHASKFDWACQCLFC